MLYNVVYPPPFLGPLVHHHVDPGREWVCVRHPWVTGGRETQMDERETRVGERDTRVGERETRVGERETRVGERDTRVGERHSETPVGDRTLLTQTH
jgi:hypothetical protein